jgi:Endoribonuclease L-PSP
MPRQIITTSNAPSSPLYSQAVKAGPHVLVSGIVGIDPGTGSLAGDTIQEQTRQTRPEGARPRRRIWPTSHSGPTPQAGTFLMIMTSKRGEPPAVRQGVHRIYAVTSGQRAIHHTASDRERRPVE